ncbi:tetratricopeptide repeat protein [Roseomonas xinghualingensis]|uniref:tetratricopeptide repeat protein n=1 Tax=Roseomonas xinghualingensis TaxID=2986475 RepID=UPI0021F0B062|nr:tetratricopeptide repeat protein [Roseomonas sp. SXEYE001]MCV4206185.1 tetratricopeptide repeat protein [Roseomonas sp. SXEYE001]
MSARDPHLAPTVPAALFRMNAPAGRVHRQPMVVGLVRSAVVVGLAFLAVPAAAQFQPALPSPPSGVSPVGEPASEAGMPRPHSRGFGILLDQASYWSAQGRPDLAQQALERLLSLDQNDPDVLATAAEMAAQSGERQVAETYVARLNQLAPGSAAAFRAASALRALSVDQGILAEARRLAQAGQQQAAMQRYRELFPQGDVPPVFAAEYYQTLAATSEENFEEARRGLAQVLERSPENRALQLAYAQMLTYSEVYRLEGVQRLRHLAEWPAIGQAARIAWRQALLWLPIDPETVDQISAYLQGNATDPEIQAKYDEAKATIIPPWVAERLAGWTAVSEKRLEDAQRGFEAARAGDPTDAESTLGLAVVRKMQLRFPEARSFFEQAVQMAPERREEFAQMVGDLSGNSAVAGRGRGQAGPPGNSVLAWQNLKRGGLDRADHYARRALRGNANERLQGEVVLGMVALRRNDFSTAETRFRTALSIRRNTPAAQAGLFEALQRQGRFAEADRFLGEAGFRPPAAAQTFRAAALREEARRAADPDARIALLRAALAADPTYSWASHDLARLLKERGQVEEARRLEQNLAARGAPDALFASALLANADGRLAETVERLEAIPLQARTEDGDRLLTENRQVLTVRQLERAARGNPRSDAAQRLISMAAQPDRTGQTQALVIHAFNRLRQTANLEAAIRAANPGAPSTTPAARVAIAGALLEAGRTADAEALAASVERDPRLSGEARQQVSNLRASSAARAAEQLSDRGERRAALERLTPALSQAPENAQLQLSLARVYAGSGRAEDASQIAEGILARNPDNIQARAVAGEAAVARNALARAEEILRDGRARNADELQMALLEARIARARGDQLRARRALEEAARLRVEQLRASSH